MSQTSHRTTTSRTELAINYQLRDVQQVVAMKHRQHVQRLQQLTSGSGTAFGSSVFSLDDIYSRWKRFAESRRQRNDCRPLYFVKVDIEDCYDSIDQFRLFEIVSRLLEKSERFAVRRYATVVAAGGRLRRLFLRDASSEADFNPSFLRFVREKIKDGRWSNAVFVDQVPHAAVDAATLIGRLRSHLLNSVVRVGRRYFKQTCGIAQGSVLSTLLCDIYYSDMEMNRITVNDQEEILMRQVCCPVVRCSSISEEFCFASFEAPVDGWRLGFGRLLKK